MRMFYYPSNKHILKHIAIFITLFLFSCNAQIDNENDNVLARANDKYLYESDLREILPQGIRTRDSLILVKNYINNWIKKNILIKKAGANLTSQQKDFTKQLEEYRNSLLIYEYEKNFVMQELDTTVTEKEINQYYAENAGNFILSGDLYRTNFMEIPDTLIDKPGIRKLFRCSEKHMLDSLANIISGYSYSYDLSNNLWMTRSEIYHLFPGWNPDAAQIPEKERIYEIATNSTIKLVIFRETIPAGDTAPLSYAGEQIREIIVNKRKSGLLKNMHRAILEEAYKNNEAEIY